MLTIKKCREHLGDVANEMSDEQVIELRDVMYELGEFALECYFEEKKKT